MSRPGEELEDSFSNYLSPFAPPVRGSDRRWHAASEWEWGPFTELTDESGGEVPQDELEQEELEGEEFGEEPEEQFEEESEEEAYEELERDELEDTELEDRESQSEAWWPIGWPTRPPPSAGPPSAGVDPSIALAPFTYKKRLLLPAGLLTAAQNAKACLWNRQRHPSESGVNPAHIRTDVARYVDLKAVAEAIKKHNAAHPSAPIQPGTPPIDAVLVEAIHQFQAKCFFETKLIDGLAGPSTLDSLGLVKRSGMNPANQVNSTAQGRLKRVETAGNIGKEFTATKWFEYMMNPTFLGLRFFHRGKPTGVHRFLMRKLREAENALLAMPKYKGRTPVELGEALGLKQVRGHGGARPTDPGAAMHGYGLAVDINYVGNPWVIGTGFHRVLKHSALLMSGLKITQPNSQTFLHNLGSDPSMTTGRIYDILAQCDRDFRRYLGLNAKPADLRAVLERRRAEGTPGVFTSADETTDQAASRWGDCIRTDLKDMEDSEVFGSRKPLNGFLNLNRDLVIALRDKVCLGWGAVDFGAGGGGSGDIMHFDVRVCGVGRAIVDEGGSTTPKAGHPCIACIKPPQGREATEFEALGEDYSSPFAEAELVEQSEDELEDEDLETVEEFEEEDFTSDYEDPELESYAPELLADEQSLAEELGEREAAGATVAYPLGERLNVVTGPAGSKADEYWDPNATGNLLVDTSAAQAGKRLSANFTVGELARSGSHRFEKARIDPRLVRCLQAIRDRVGKAVRVNSGYRSWGYNQQLYRGQNQTATPSRHCSGQAADIGVAGMSGLDVAKAAIDACGGNIAVGIDKGFAHIDVRGKWAAWTYPGLGGATERSRTLQAIEQYRSQRGRAGVVTHAAPSPPAARPAPAPAAARPAVSPSTSRDADVRTVLRIADSPVSVAVGAEPELPGVTVGGLIEHWRQRISPEIPAEILRAFIRFESGGRFDDATHGTTKNRWTSPEFYELGIFQTPAGLHGRCTSGDRRAKDCEFLPPGREKPGQPSPWVQLCRKIGADPMQWRNPTTQVQVGLRDLEEGAARLRQAYPDLFPTPGSDWDLRMAVLYRFSRGGGAARSFLNPFRAQLAAMPESQRWAFLRDKQVVVKNKKGSRVRLFQAENVDKKMVLAAKLGYVPLRGAGAAAAPPLTPQPEFEGEPPAVVADEAFQFEHEYSR